MMPSFNTSDVHPRLKLNLLLLTLSRNKIKYALTYLLTQLNSAHPVFHCLVGVADMRFTVKGIYACRREEIIYSPYLSFV